MVDDELELEVSAPRLRAGRTRPLPPHGTVARYGHRRAPCSCARCRAAKAEDQAEVRAQYARPVQLRLPPEYRWQVGR